MVEPRNLNTDRSLLHNFLHNNFFYLWACLRKTYTTISLRLGAFHQCNMSAGRVGQHNFKKVDGLLQVLWFSPPIIYWLPSYDWNIFQYGLKQQSQKKSWKLAHKLYSTSSITLWTFNFQALNRLVEYHISQSLFLSFHFFYLYFLHLQALITSSQIYMSLFSSTFMYF